jgi:hypothetical protein
MLVRVDGTVVMEFSSFRRPEDLFAKLKRDSAALHARVDADRLFNFTVTAWSLKDWITKSSCSQDEQTEIWSKIPEEQRKYLQVCGDIANGFKHFKLDSHAEKKRILSGIVVFTPAVPGRLVLGSTMLGSLGKHIISTRSDGSFDIEEFQANIIQIYEALLLPVADEF